MKNGAGGITSLDFGLYCNVMVIKTACWFDLLAVQGILKEFSSAPQFKSINSLALSLLYGPTLTSVHEYWVNYSFDYTDL